MKNYLTLLISCIILLSGCSEESSLVEYAKEIDSELVQNESSVFMSGSLNQDWENFDVLTIYASAGDNNVISPWSNGIVTTTIPADVRKDVKKADGWEMIAHTLNMDGSMGADRGTNYIFFHNKFTGVFKVFFYLDPAYNILNNTAVWSVNFTQPTGNLLKFVGPIGIENTTPYLQNINQVYASNISSISNTSMGLMNGWNAFVLEMAYDPSSTPNVMTIVPMIGQNVDISLTGTFSSKTDGTILMKQTTGNNILGKLISSVSKFIGGGAGEVAESIIGEGKISNVVEKAVEKSVNKKMNSFLGIFNTTTTTEGTLSLTTTGEIKMSGQSNFTAAAISGLCQLSINQDLSRKLGAWSLNSPIVVYVSPIAYYKEPASGAGFDEHMYELSGDYRISTPSISINPNIQPYISNLKVSTDLYYCDFYKYMNYRNPNVNHPLGTLAQSHSFSSSPKIFFYEDLYYENFKEQYHAFIENMTNEPPYSVDISRPYGNGYTIEYGKGIANRHIVRVTVSFDARIGNKVNKVVSTRTFVPKLEWM